MYSQANSSLCAYFGKYWAAQNVAKWSIWPNQCTAFFISIASTLLSLKYNSGQATSLHPISVFFLHTKGKLHVPTMGILACTRPISILSIQRLTYIYLKLLDVEQHILCYTYTEHVEHQAAPIQWAHWALSSTHKMSLLSIGVVTYNEHIMH